jgi:hypothetical protein
VEPERLQLDLAVQADDADPREGDRVAEPQRHTTVEQRVGHGGAADPRF